MSDVFDVLGTDHADVKRMLIALEDSPGQASGASEAVLDARRLVVQWLVIDSSRHEARARPRRCLRSWTSWMLARLSSMHSWLSSSRPPASTSSSRKVRSGPSCAPC